MTAHQAFHRVAPMCRTLGVSPSGYYARHKRPLSLRARRDLELSAEIAAIHRRSRGTYGAPRIHAELAAGGIHVGRKRIARLMRSIGVHGVSRRKQFRTTVRDEQARPAPDLVARQFTVPGPNQLWVADISGQFRRALCQEIWSHTAEDRRHPVRLTAPATVRSSIDSRGRGGGTDDSHGPLDIHWTGNGATPHHALA